MRFSCFWGATGVGEFPSSFFLDGRGEGTLELPADELGASMSFQLNPPRMEVDLRLACVGVTMEECRLGVRVSGERSLVSSLKKDKVRRHHKCRERKTYEVKGPRRRPSSQAPGQTVDVT